MLTQLMTGLIVCGLVSGSAMAATFQFIIDGENTIASTNARKILVDGEGVDWTTAALKIDLTAGSVYNDPNLDSDSQQQGLWGSVPELQWDSYVGIPGDGTGGIAGGAGDLGGGPQNIGGTAVSVTWFNTSIANTGLTQIGNITLTDDAAGTWQMIVGFASGTFIKSGVFTFFLPSGDFDGDGFVGQADLDLVLLNWGDTSPPAPPGWVNEIPDGLIGQEALDNVLLNWGAGTTAIASVPEPASAGLAILLFGLAGGSGRIRRA